MKIGKGKSNSKPSEEKFRKKLIQNAARFEKALDDYLKATTGEREGLHKQMTELVSLIHDSTAELSRSGIQKQLSRVESDYKRYLRDPSKENYTSLIQDLSTLREYGRLPTLNQLRAEHKAKKGSQNLL